MEQYTVLVIITGMKVTIIFLQSRIRHMRPGSCSGTMDLLQTFTPSLYGNSRARSQNSEVELIPYQWDLSDVEDVNGNHTRAIYNSVLVSLRTGFVSSDKQYTRGVIYIKRLQMDVERR